MLVLVINCGSSSLKYQLIDMENENALCKGNCERIGIENSFIKHSANGNSTIFEVEIKTHRDALFEMLKIITSGTTAIINDISEVKAIGHRIGHGGDKFKQSALINDEVLYEIEKLAPFAPLHTPAMVSGIKSSFDVFGKDVPNIAVFDTGFHVTIPPKAYMYALPYDFYEQHGVRRYGFHGTSHKYVASVAADYLGKPISELKIITCHLGNGSSVTAIDGGRSVDTSMGFTPIAGLVMGTRCGDVDVGAILHLQEKLGLTASEMSDILNKQAGLLGVSGLSSDSRDIVSAVAQGHERAKLANEMMCYHVKKYIGAYAAVMGGLDAVIFTGGIGEKDADIRLEICENLEFLGIKLDLDKNRVRGLDINDFSSEDSAVKTLAICTDEELMIARDSAEIVRSLA